MLLQLPDVPSPAIDLPSFNFAALMVSALKATCATPRSHSWHFSSHCLLSFEDYELGKIFTLPVKKRLLAAARAWKKTKQLNEEQRADLVDFLRRYCALLHSSHPLTCSQSTFARPLSSPTTSRPAPSPT